VWLESDQVLQEIVMTNLSVLENAGILRTGFRDRFLGAEFKKHPGYYGTLLWVLTCLGLWLEEQRIDIR
jgi:asparagine synthase (glutamine-hydrolysing)